MYGLKQSPQYFFKNLSTRIEKAGCHPSNLDPCLFLVSKVVVIWYVDNLLVYVYGDTNETIDALIKRMEM